MPERFVTSTIQLWWSALISLPLRVAKPEYSPPLTTWEPAGHVAIEVASLVGLTT